MTFTQLIQTSTTSSEATLLLLGADQKQYAVTVTADLVRQLQAALLVVSSHLAPPAQGSPHTLGLDVAALETFWSEDGRGVVFELKSGAEFALKLDDPALRVALRECIDKLDRPTRQEDVH